MLLALVATCRPGSVLLTEELTYMGALAAAKMLDLRVETVRIDRDGAVPAEFAKACKRHRPAAFYCIPTLQNPTSTIMPAGRRREIAELADAHGVVILEDEVQAYLAADAPPPLVTFTEQPGYYMNSLSKSVAGGLRVGFLRKPEPANARVENGMWGTTLNAPTPLVEVGTHLMASGTLDRIEDARRETARRRNQFARELLADHVAPGSSPDSQFLWLEREGWNVDAVVARATALGVRVLPGTEFAAAGRTERRGIRVSLAHESHEDRFAEGIARLQRAIAGRGGRRMPGV